MLLGLCVLFFAIISLSKVNVARRGEVDLGDEGLRKPRHMQPAAVVATVLTLGKP